MCRIAPCTRTHQNTFIYQKYEVGVTEAGPNNPIMLYDAFSILPYAMVHAEEGCHRPQEHILVKRNVQMMMMMIMLIDDDDATHESRSETPNGALHPVLSHDAQ